jgi:hypothetical protein
MTRFTKVLIVTGIVSAFLFLGVKVKLDPAFSKTFISTKPSMAKEFLEEHPPKLKDTRKHALKY